MVALYNTATVQCVSCTGNYTDYEKTRSDKNLSNTRSQDLINKERKHIEETIQKLQVGAHRHRGVLFVLSCPLKDTSIVLHVFINHIMPSPHLSSALLSSPLLSLPQIKASRDSSGKGSGMVASRKKKLARYGAEKDENGHKFNVQVRTEERKRGTGTRTGRGRGRWLR